MAAIERATSTVAFGAAGGQMDPDVLATVAAACRDRERLAFVYRDRQDASSERRGEPHALVNAGRRWYLVGWDRDRDDWRTFRLDRIARLRVAGGRCEPRDVPGGDPAAFVRDRIAPAHRFEAIATIRASAADVRPMRWLGGTVQPIDDHTCRLCTSDADLEWLGLRIASIPFDFRCTNRPSCATGFTSSVRD